MASEEREKVGLLRPTSPVPSGEDVLTDDEASTLAQDEEEVLKDDYESDQEGTSIGAQPTGVLGRIFRKKQNGPEYHRPSRRHRERRRRGEVQSETMYEMEEGGEVSMSSGSSNASDDELQTMKESRRKNSSGRLKKRFGHACCYIAIVAFFIGILVGAYSVTKKTKVQRKPVTLMSNGTSLFAPTTLLISLDGFRADFLQRGLTPTLNGFVKEGVSPLYMMPPFPSVTFVSHYTMATGLFPEEHGIVGNSFWEPTMKDTFTYTDPKHSMEPEWWGGEPFWVTAERQGVKTAIHMYPGSEAHIGGVDLTYVDDFKHDEPLENKAKRVLEWLDLPGPKSPETIADSPRPQFIVAYVPDVDSDGHLYGPNSTEIQSTIKSADNMLTTIFDGLKSRNLTNIVNVVIVSDHGMATTSVDRLIQLDDFIDMEKIEHIDGWPLYGLRPKRDEDILPLYHQLKDHAKTNPNFEVYLRDKDMPPEYHFSNNPRIAPLWVVPKTGWAIVRKKDYDVQKAQAEGRVFEPRGIHGYDYRHPLMRAIFVARGPAFPHQPHSRMEAFENLNVYNIICDSLHLDPAPNNGTLRLPLTTSGLHSDPDAPVLEPPVDYPDDGVGQPHSVSLSSFPSFLSSPVSSTTPIKPPAPITPSPPTSPSQAPDEEQDTPKKKPTIWEWFETHYEELKDKIESLFGSKDEEKDHRS